MDYQPDAYTAWKAALELRLSEYIKEMLAHGRVSIKQVELNCGHRSLVNWGKTYREYIKRFSFKR